MPMCVGTAGAAAAVAKVLCVKARQLMRLTMKFLDCISAIVYVLCAAIVRQRYFED